MQFLDYSQVRFSSNILYLYFSRILTQIGLGMYGTFGVIFLYEQFHESITNVLVLYILLVFGMAAGTHIGAKFIGLLGMKKMMIVSTIFLIGMTLSFYFWNQAPITFLLIFFVSFVMYRSLYWIPYHVEFAQFADKKTRGKQLAIFSNISEVFLAILPIIAGFLIAYEGYETAFLLATIISSLSVIPLFFIQETHEQYTWNFIQLIKELFQKENRALVISSIGNGARFTVNAVIWPIFIFILLDGSYSAVGIITSLTIVTLIALRFFVGNALDKMDREKILRIGTIADTTGWIVKLFIETGTGIFLAHTYHNFGRMVNKLSFDTEIYEQAADNGHYIDEYTVLKEMAFFGGRILMLGLSIFIIGFIGIKATFIVAALASLVMVYATKKVRLD